MEQKCYLVVLLLTFLQSRSFLLTFSFLQLSDALFSFSISHCIVCHSSCFQKLPMLEEQLGNLVSDDPCVIENTLDSQGDTVFPDQTSVMHRYLYFWLFSC